MQNTSRRKTSQRLAPARHAPPPRDGYRLYPVVSVPAGSVGIGFGTLAEELCSSSRVRIDGYVGIFWEDIRHELTAAFSELGKTTTWLNVSAAMKSSLAIASLVEPFLGGEDPLFGKRCPLDLAEFFDLPRLAELQPDMARDVTVIYGCGAGLVPWDGPLVYVDLPKNELQFRSRAGATQNLGAADAADAKAQYKQFYFVDWPVLNRHKSRLVHQVDWFVDGQRSEEPTWIAGHVARRALDQISCNAFRVRPWFEPGPWGGQWLKEHLPELPQDVLNYAWSFELIVPENGLMFCDGQFVVELSFDWLMYQNHERVLGSSAARFGHEFPLRFDFLDTFGGGNLSLQCHPRSAYIRTHFGETFTQDETYYILDCKAGAEVYLGFVEGVNPREFRAALEHSEQTQSPVDVSRFVRKEPSRKHGLYLIPAGTVHCSGVDNLVLEISATPYIFTFKMYDWLRMDLDGKPRPLNIRRALENVDFSRQGSRIPAEFVSHPTVIAAGEDWQLRHLPTHGGHFYDVQRVEFDTQVTGFTNGSPHVMMLVHGQRITVETADLQQEFHYAETFVIPAAAGSYRLINRGGGRAMVIKAFIKSGRGDELAGSH